MESVPLSPSSLKIDLAAVLRRSAVHLPLFLLLCIGVYFRFHWVNWSEGTSLHPDEYGLTNTLTQLQIPDSFADYLNTRISPLSPYDKYDENGAQIARGPDNAMRWGQWPIILLKWAAVITDNAGYSEQRLLGRSVSALADTLALLLILLIGRRLYNTRVGLLGAALSALAVMQIQQSHFMTVDNFGVLFATAAMYCAVRVAQGGGGRWYALFGVAFGMTIAARINLFPLFGLLLAAVFIARFDSWEDQIRSGGDLWPSVLGALGWVMLAVVAAVLTFRVTHPMSFRAETGDTTLLTWRLNPNWSEAMATAQRESNGIGGGPPAEQWTNRPAIVFPLVNMVLWGMGLPLGVAAWAGALWAAWRAVRANEWKAHLLPLLWAGGYFLFMGTRWVKSVRYFLPIYPFLALLAAWGLYALWQWAQRPRVSGGPGALPRRLVAGTAFALVVSGTLIWAWGFTSIYRNPNTRVQASLWAFQNIPAPFVLHLRTPDGPYNEPIPFGDGAQITADAPSRVEIRPLVNGTLERISVFRARNASHAAASGVVQVVAASDPDGKQVLAEALLRVGDAFIDERGASSGATFSGQVAFEVGKSYYVFFSALEGGPIQIARPVVSVEDWDEGIPMPFAGRDPFGGLYHGITMGVRWLDDENKRQMLLANLAQVDYIVLPSQRALWSHSRLPKNYPMTMEYYRALFDGRLGFELAAEFQSPITLGPLQISDVAGTWAWGARPDLTPEPDSPFNFNLFAAEEAFSVYDHAPVWIFRKRPDFSLDRMSELLNSVDLSQVVNQAPRDVTLASPRSLLLSGERLNEQRSGGTWSALFPRNLLINRSEVVAVLAWWALIYLFGLAAFPLTRAAFPGLRDGGYPISRIVGLLLVSWTVWILGSLRVPFSRATILATLVALALVSALILRRRQDELMKDLRENWKDIAWVEALAFALFLAFLLIRLGNPDLWHPAKGGEKPMDFSYLNAVLKSTTFPPYDPWFAGGYINYYYYGFVLAAVPIKLLGLNPSVAYNLVIPTLFSLSGLAAFSVAFSLVGRRCGGDGARHRMRAAGLAAALALVVLGNLGTMQMVYEGWKTLGATGGQAPASSIPGVLQAVRGLTRQFVEGASQPYGLDAWYWNPSRAIPPGPGEPGPITEFPFFTFLYADLHAHMINLPLTIVCLAWALSWLLSARDKQPLTWRSLALQGLVGGIALGALRPTNTWDFPVYWGLAGLGMAMAACLRDGRVTRRAAFEAVLTTGVVLGLAYLLYQPYNYWYGAGYTQAELWKGGRTSISAYFTVHGLFLFVLSSWMVWEARQWMASTPLSALSRLRPHAQWIVAGSLGFVGAVAILLGLGYAVALVIFPAILLSALLVLKPQISLEKRIALVLTAAALALTFVVEVVVLKGDIGRMNTVFKFYIQVWTLFCVASAAALLWIFDDLHLWGVRWSRGWLGVLALLVMGAALYPATAAPAKIKDRMAPDAPHSLDGMAFMPYAEYYDLGGSFSLRDDYEAVRWMQDYVEGSPVIIEANVPEYRWGSRFTIYTGLPGVLGWNWHQRQQRVATNTDDVGQRALEINDFYLSRSADEAQAFIDRYDVRYIVVGNLERLYYGIMQPCYAGSLPELVTCDMGGRPFGMIAPPLSQADCLPIDPGNPSGPLACATHSLLKFEDMTEAGDLRAVYQSERTVIYEVVQ